ncbi:hypothetical protein KZ294_27690, partial [Escherichia coli]|nr:hypothetical protein [Escherichia coli]
AFNMSERKEFAHIFKTKTADSAVLAITFLLTVFFDLTTGVGVGLLFAIIMFVKRMSQSLHVSKTNHDDEKSQLQMYTLEG